MRKQIGKDIGARVALAGIGAAFSLVCVTLSYFVSVMSLTFTVLTAVGIMIPLSKNYYREAILASIVVGVAGFFIANLRIIPFLLASGLYVVLSVFLHNKKVNQIITFVAKIAYSCLVFFICYKLINVISVDVSKISFLANFNQTGLYAILNLVFSLAFILYDFLLIKGYEYSKTIINKIIKPKNND